MSEAGRHPIQDCPDLPLDRRVQLLEIHLAQLHDQVWWLSLTPARRDAYRRDGFRDPVMTEEEYNKARAEGVGGHIERFYEDR